MPGSRMRIFDSKAIVEQDVKLCLLTLSLTSEENVLSKNQEFLKSGGQFYSTYPGSKLALPI